ncbi:hypothetical protein PZ897_03150 [Hoeflea sp. YIM 152468]|uniref:hypothetical protein n=1 Tax=Hoeflea sp. YIM 152468 TaxID=3031759 RepID=UPI0023DB8D98|nr:hypothetical protein [Hoeflea sp. YIM 152468]MDF1607166.1 hypothetical protein [Hoeflea sp. YIM 152468]
MTFQLNTRRLLSSVVLVAALSSFALPALALDPDDFATKFAAVASQGGAQMSFASIEPAGGAIVLKSMRFEAPGQPAVELGDVTFNGVEEIEDGSYFVDQTGFDDIEFRSGPAKVSISDLEISGLVIPAEAVFDTLDNILFYESFSTGKINVEQDGADVFSMASLDLDVDRADDDSRVAIEMTGSGIGIDLGQIDDAKAKQALADLGYTSLTGDLKLDAAWEVEPGTINLREYSLTLDEVGRIAMSLHISGYTLDFIQAMQEAQTGAASSPDSQATQQAMGFAMMGMLQQLSFNSASIRFDDASVTEKALSYAGKQQGISGEQMRQSVKFMLPLMLGQLGIPALQQQISEAASVYLDNPQNLTISARPASPVAVPMIMGAGMGNPKSLVDLLNVQVTANDPVEFCCKE